MLGIILAFVALSFSTFWAGATPVLSVAHQARATPDLSDAHQTSVTSNLDDEQRRALFNAAVQQALGRGGLEAMHASTYCSPEESTGINPHDCREALVGLVRPWHMKLFTTEFGPNKPDTRFRLLNIHWHGSCGVVITSVEPGATVVTNYATIFHGVHTLIMQCAAVSGAGGTMRAGGLYLAILNPATAPPELKQALNQCLSGFSGVDVPPGCTSAAQYIAHVAAVRGRPSE